MLGSVTIKVTSLRWLTKSPPPVPLAYVTLQWWGDNLSDPTTFQPAVHALGKVSHPAGEVECTFPILAADLKMGAKMMSNYLRDMGHLALTVYEVDPVTKVSTPVAKASMPVTTEGVEVRREGKGRGGKGRS